MLQFLVKRLIGLAFVILGITLITFIIGHATTGDPIRTMMGQNFDVQRWQLLRRAYGLDLPWYQQYYNFLVHFLQFDFGNSFHYQNRSVNDILADGLPTSIELAFWGFIITLFVGIPAGILSAIKSKTWVDITNMAVALTFYAVPVFATCVFAQVLIAWFNTLFGTQWPISDWGTPWQYSWTDIEYKLAPIIVYSASGYAYFARLARTSMLEILHQDYIRTAHAKGLRERAILYRHALRNAIIPLVTYFGYVVGLFVQGAFFIEVIFNIHGIAQITVDASHELDYPIIEATVIVIAIATVIGNLIADILYTLFDPRIKLS